MALWDAWRVDPASTQFGAAEVAACVELGWLTDEFVAGPSGGRKFDRVSASELRLRMDGLGLTAKGKRDLRWRAPSEHAADPKSEGPKLAEVRRLRAIDPAA